MAHFKASDEEKVIVILKLPTGKKEENAKLIFTLSALFDQLAVPSRRDAGFTSVYQNVW